MKYPIVKVHGEENSCVVGWENINSQLANEIASKSKKKVIVVVETYQGVYYDNIFDSLKKGLNISNSIDASEAMFSDSKIREITHRDVTDHRIFGHITQLKIEDYFNPEKVLQYQKKIESITQGIVLVYGTGSSLLAPKHDILVYADMARWEIQLRMRKNEVNNLGLQNKNESSESKYKIGYFVDWRVCDRLKKRLINNWDFVLDTNNQDVPKMITGDVLRKGLTQTANQPFSVVPYFDEGIWGGQWMKDICDLDKSKKNYAWCINCIPEENSLLLAFGDIKFEIPSINVVFYKPVELLGDPVHARFGDEFPIRFDFLDTMEGGNLSLQVHPTTEYIQQEFGMNYTQDESYYMLEAKDDASVYLGLQENTNPDDVIHDLEYSEKNNTPFEDNKHIQNWPAKKHDHFLIPAGTIHCSGKNGVVLEISSTPYIFTFKLYDWARVDSNGVSRPINIQHGKNVINWNSTTSWTKENLINKIELIEEGNGWREERTGLHKREFIETRRHWFTKKVLHHTNESVNVLNLIEGSEAIIESPTNAFEPFVVHYAETFIIPASVKEYTIRPYGEATGQQCATMKAFVRK